MTHLHPFLRGLSNGHNDTRFFHSLSAAKPFHIFHLLPQLRQRQEDGNIYRVPIRIYYAYAGTETAVQGKEVAVCGHTTSNWNLNTGLPGSKDWIFFMTSAVSE